MLKTLHKLFPPKVQPLPVPPQRGRELPQQDTPWEESDAKEWYKFCHSTTGVRLMQRARTVEYHNSIRANQDCMHPSHSAGCAVGFSECLKWLESMKFSQPAATQQEQSDDGEQNQAASPAFRRF